MFCWGITVVFEITVMVLFSIVTRTDHLDNQCSHVSGVPCHHCYLSPLCLHLSSVWSRGLAYFDFNIMHSVFVKTCLYKCCTSSLYSILIRLQLVSAFVCENFYNELRTTLMQNYWGGIATSRILDHNCFPIMCTWEQFINSVMCLWPPVSPAGYGWSVTLPVLLVLLAGLQTLTAQICPPCTCSVTLVDCRSRGLTSFPQIPPDIQRTVSTL